MDIQVQTYPRRGIKTKNIKSRIRTKIDEWLASITDDEVKRLATKNTIVTGGCIASMLLGEKVNDFDIYFRDYQTAYQVARYYVEKFGQKTGFTKDKLRIVSEDGRIKIVIQSAGVANEDGSSKPYQYFESRPEQEAGDYVGQVMEDPAAIEEAYEDTEAKALEQEDDGKDKYRPVFMSTNAITLSNKVQIVLRFYGEPDSIHENYDFAHCTNYWTSWDSALTLRQQALEALLARDLKYVGSKYPIASVIRMRKFIQRGWVINAGQILKMAMQISELNLKDINVLRDQLTGVDVAYFMQVVDLLAQKNPEKVDYAYLIEIIDRMF